MKKIIALLVVVIISFASCEMKIKKPKEKNKIEDSTIALSKTYFDNNWNKLDQDKKNNIRRKQYYDLKLDRLSFIGAYGDMEYQIGNILVEGETRKLLTVKAIASGEISEYLLGYIDNTITDSLLVAYEDNVEYFSITSSVIDGNKITVTTVNWDYSGMEDVADSIVTKYTITPLLTFEEIIVD